MKKRVLFLCTHNSARSQMAEGLMNHLLGDRYIAFSAGTKPSSVHPYAIDVLAEAGVDISGSRSKGVAEFVDEEFDYVVTVCDNAAESCPFFPGGGEYIHRGFINPSFFGGGREELLAGFRGMRDEIKNWLLETFE